MQLKTTAPLTAVLLLLLVSAPAVAAPADTTDSSEDEDDEGDTIVNIDLGEVVDAINNLIHDFDEFTENWDDTMKELLKAVFFGPFLALLKYLVTQLIAVLTHTPDVYPNPAIEEIWQLSYLVTISLSGLAFAFAGILYMVGPLLGVPYSKVRKILPRIISHSYSHPSHCHCYSTPSTSATR